jgi:phosphohistidine phosphatase
MKFLLIRHADAQPLPEGSDLEDMNRPLTDKGIAQCKILATALLRISLPLGKVVSSPYLRAVQTAEELLKHYPEPKPEIHQSPPLEPGGKEKKLSRFLRGLDTEHVTLIGHMPDLAAYAGWLIGSKKAQLALTKTGAAYIESDTGPGKGCGTLTWLITPAWCGC